MITQIITHETCLSLSLSLYTYIHVHAHLSLSRLIYDNVYIYIYLYIYIYIYIMRVGWEPYVVGHLARRPNFALRSWCILLSARTSAASGIQSEFIRVFKLIDPLLGALFCYGFVLLSLGKLYFCENLYIDWKKGLSWISLLSLLKVALPPSPSRSSLSLSLSLCRRMI